MLLVILTVIIISLLSLKIFLLQREIRTEKILTYFATSLYGQNSVEDIFWDVAKNCISHLGFQDCVIYQYDKLRNVLVQRAAFGPKNPEKYEILNPIEIPLGAGIVGGVARSRQAEIISDTSKDERYIVDDNRRNSEIAVPILIDGELFGVIDSEHSRKNFYTAWHLKMLQEIAEICAVKIAKYKVEEKLRLKIARDLHDEMGSTLTSINIISKMAMSQDHISAQLHKHLSKIRDHSSKMMETMSDIVWAINPANDTFEKVLLRMKEFAAEIMEPAGVNYFFREDGPMETIPLNLQQRKDIYMIFKEAVNNAVKYSRATEVHISVKWNNGMLQMIIMDNGNGFEIANNHSGNGINNMTGRAKDMDASLKIDSIKGTGTSVSLLLPVTSLG